MNIERMDGFFCALIVGPDLVMPSECWEYVIGTDAEEHGPTFDSEEHAQTIMELVMRHWNAIARALNDDDIYVPLLLGDDNGEPRGNDWATGFMHGVTIRQASWQPLLDDEEGAAAVVPMMALALENNPELKSEFEPLLSEDREEVLAMMAAGITEVYDYFEPMRAQSAEPVEPFMRSQPKIGRNEPCPCGSGKKYKQCCMTRMH
jgi:uncharacterized protein